MAAKARQRWCFIIAKDQPTADRTLPRAEPAQRKSAAEELEGDLG